MNSNANAQLSIAPSTATTSAAFLNRNSSIESITISYLKGELTFQQYESMLEDQHLKNSLVAAHTANQNVQQTSEQQSLEEEQLINEIEIYNQTSQSDFGLNSNQFNFALTPYLGDKSINRKRSISNSSSSSSPNKKNSKGSGKETGKKVKDRFLNMKKIVCDDVDNQNEASEVTSNDEEEGVEINNLYNYKNQSTKNDKKSESESRNNDEEDYDDDDDDDEFDDASKWQDFDIETLNFDKFIKDHQSDNNLKEGSNKSASNIPNTRKSQTISNQASNNSNKRKLNNEITDPYELKAKRRRNRVLPIEIQGLMGEANLAYARGETNRAIDVCLEVIKYAPKASEPYQLLSLLYSEMGQNDKALRVGLIAAQLNKDPDEWVQLISQALIEGDFELVLFCYNNAIQTNPKNIQLQIERIKLLSDKNDTRRLILAKIMLLKYIDINKDLDIYNTYFNQLMNELSNQSDKNKKIFVLKTDMKKFQDKFPVERLKLLIELLMEQKAFKESIMIMMNQSKITAKSNNNDVEASTPFLSTFESFQFLNDYQFDIPPTCNSYVKALFISCLIHLDYDKESALISDFYNIDVEQCSQEFLLLADTYYQKKNFKMGKKLYHLLLTNVKDFLVHVDIWLKYGNCCNYLNDIDDAINAYRNAVNLDDSNCEAALSLVNVLKKNELLFDEASTVIKNTLKHKKSQPLTIEVLNLMINECFIQYELKNYSLFLANTRNLLFSNLFFVLEPDNINALLKVDSKVQRAIVFHQMLEENNYQMEFSYNKLNPQLQNTIFDVYLKLCKALVHLKLYDDLLTYSIGATVLPLVYERMDWNKSINFTCLIACILKHDGKNAFNILKDFILEFKNSNKLWSYVGIVIGLCPSLNQQKFFIRLGAKYMDHLPLCLINAHFAIMSGTYRYALVEYMNCFKQNPFDPFINLIISITYCHISCQKYNTKRHLIVSQSLVFLRRYIKFRGISQETYYNVARVLHQLSLFDLAAYYYQKCLELPCTFPEQKEIYDLSRFAAYNLINIYKHSGSLELARHVMKKYLTI